MLHCDLQFVSAKFEPWWISILQRAKTGQVEIGNIISTEKLSNYQKPNEFEKLQWKCVPTAVQNLLDSHDIWMYESHISLSSFWLNVEQ